MVAAYPDDVGPFFGDFEDFADDLAVLILPFSPPAHGPLVHDVPVEDERLRGIVVQEVPEVLGARRFGAEV